MSDSLVGYFIILVVCVALVAFLFYIDKKIPKFRESGETEAPPKAAPAAARQFSFSLPRLSGEDILVILGVMVFVISVNWGTDRHATKFYPAALIYGFFNPFNYVVLFAIRGRNILVAGIYGCAAMAIASGLEVWSGYRNSYNNMDDLVGAISPWVIFAIALFGVRQLVRDRTPGQPSKD